MEFYKVIKNKKINFSVENLIKISALFIILLLTVIIRLLPLRYGAYISEFDPYIQFLQAEFIVTRVVENGFLGFTEYFQWHNNLTWHPEGVDMATRYLPGVPFAGALLHLLFMSIGMNWSLETTVIYFPIITAVISVFLVYLIGKKINGVSTGLFAALFFSLTPAFITRSSLGWYDTETVGILCLLATIFFYLSALKKENPINKRYIFGILSGVFLGLMSASWGAYQYLAGVLAIVAIIITIFGYRPQNFERINLLTIVVGSGIISLVPKHGFKFLYSPIAVLLYIGVLLPFLFKYLKISLKENKKEVVLIGLTTTLIFLILIVFGPLSQISLRYLSVVNPFIKISDPVVQSVQEHAGAGAGAFFYYFTFLIPFIFYGFYNTLKKLDEQKIVILIFAFTSIYAASSFSRLGILTAPFMAIMAAIGLSTLLNLIYKHLSIFNDVKHTKYSQKNNKILYFVIVCLILFITILPFTVAVNTADTPVTIASSSLPIRYELTMWLDALEWINQNIPEDAVVGAWWDYGYWISVIGERRTVADNATWNSTRIAVLATMFLSEEDKAVEIAEDLDIDYIVVFVTTRPVMLSDGALYYCLVQCTGSGFGEESKFLQMANIAEIPKEKFMDLETGQLYPQFWNTLLGRMIPYELMVQHDGIDFYIEQFKYPDDGWNFEDEKLVLVYRSPGAEETGIDILIYKIVK